MYCLYLDAGDHEGEGDNGVEVSATCWSSHISNQGDQHLKQKDRLVASAALTTARSLWNSMYPAAANLSM